MRHADIEQRGEHMSYDMSINISYDYDIVSLVWKHFYVRRISWQRWNGATKTGRWVWSVIE